jgi:hypothetical protein
VRPEGLSQRKLRLNSRGVDPATNCATLAFNDNQITTCVLVTQFVDAASLASWFIKSKVGSSVLCEKVGCTADGMRVSFQFVTLVIHHHVTLWTNT